MAEKFRHLINIFKNENIELIVMSTLYTQIDRYNIKVKQFNEFLKKISYKENIIYIDLNQELAINERLKDEYSFDGIHLTYKGYLIIRNQLKKFIEK